MAEQRFDEIELIRVKKDEFEAFKKQSSLLFLKGLQATFPEQEHLENFAPIPSEQDYNESLYSDNPHVYYFYLNGRNIGGAMFEIDKENKRSHVDTLYINDNAHGQGIGTKVWELHTPYFEKRNIHFYINKCNFHITGFYKEMVDVNGVEKEFEFFKFEKIMS
ncbi:GNAT family N-acetyltransferase [Staphylococcus xylosus]|uniref:GNAT family N-acetyltransferase n=1 Tax=Staphylococcus xylosus TaxID=1288 RepID=UPI003F57E8A7